MRKAFLIKRLFALRLRASALAALLACTAFFPAAASADSYAAGMQFDFASVPTPNVFVMDAGDGTVWYERNADKKAFPASTTKIMTCILALENGDPSDVVTVGNEVLGTKTTFTKYSSLMGLTPGETVTLNDLLYGLMMVSGNDAAEAIAVHVSGSVDAFADLMNRKAASLGMTGTHYANPHGVQDESHYTTARDIGILTTYALRNPVFREIVAATKYSVPASNLRAEPMTLYNSNRLLRKPSGDAISCVYEYAIGVKTGDTNAAGKCLVAAAERNGACLIAVLLGDTAAMYANDADRANLARFLNARDIFEDLFNNVYRTADAASSGLPTIFSQECANAAPTSQGSGRITVTADLSGLTLYSHPAGLERIAARAGEILCSVEPPAGGLTAPLPAGTPAGTVLYTLDGTELLRAPLFTASDVPAADQAPLPDGTPASGPAYTPSTEPLVKRGFFNRFGFLGWLFLLMVLLLTALIVIFLLTEKKRQRERMRRRRVHRAEGTGSLRYQDAHRSRR